MYIRNTDYTGPEEMQLHCPECGFEYTHFVGFREFSGHEGRKGIELIFDCEEGHQFEVQFRNHKGYTLLATSAKNGGEWCGREPELILKQMRMQEFEAMKLIEPVLGTIEREVIARNEEAAHEEIYWHDVWAEIKPALQQCVGAYCKHPEIASSTHWDKAGSYLESIATNMK